MAEENLGWVDCKCLMTWHTSGLRGDAESSPGNAGGTERLIRRVLKCPKLYTRRNNNLAPTDGGCWCCCCCCCCCFVDLVPRFGESANNCLSKETVLEHVSEFRLSKYFQKELFYALQ